LGRSNELLGEHPVELLTKLITGNPAVRKSRI